MFVAMTGILLVGICVLVLIFCLQSHKASRQLGLVRTEVQSESRSVLDDAARLEQRLIERLLEGGDIGECISEYRRDRAALVPGAGPKWNEQVLSKRIQEKAEQQASEIKQKAFYTTAISLVLTVSIFAGATLATYAAFSKSSASGPAELPAPISATGAPTKSVTP